MKNYYELLEVSNTASIEVIRAAYKAGVKRHHPDNYAAPNDKAKATEHLKLLNEALEILTDEILRAKYDKELAMGMDSFKHEKANQNTDNLTTYVESLIVHCKDEAEYLDLHDLILKSNTPETEKLQMLGILDKFTQMRLQQELIDESKLEEYRQEARFFKGGLIFWLIIGIGLSAKFWWAFWVDIALCIIAYRNAKGDRENLAKAEYAAKHIAIYRMRGFKI